MAAIRPTVVVNPTTNQVNVQAVGTQGPAGAQGPPYIIAATRAQVASNAVIACSIPIPVDGTAPQNTEGNQVLSIDYAPRYITSNIEVTATISGSASDAMFITAAMFQDAVAAAIPGSVVISETFGPNMKFTMSWAFTVAAVNTNTRTFALRVGPDATGTAYLNGDGSGNPLFGGTMECIITAREVLTPAVYGAVELAASNLDVVACSTVIPVDNTVPQITEGNQVVALAYKPSFATSNIEITYCLSGSSDTAAFVVAAAFQGVAAAALTGSVAITQTLGGNTKFSISQTFLVAAGDTSTRTYSLRVGPDAAANIYVNGDGSGNLIFGGSLTATLKAREVVTT